MKPKVELYSLPIERALVACALTDGTVYDLSNVQANDFHDAIHAKVWRVIGELRQAGEFVDGVTVHDALEASDAGVGLSELTHIEATAANANAWETYANRVREYAHRRRVVGLAERVAGAALRSNGSYADDLAALRDELGRAVERLQPAREAVTTGWTAAELLAASFHEPVWAVPGFIPVGLTVLAGRPKVGKSWLALQVAIAKSSGGMALNQRLEAGKVLYLALEDNGRRLQDRTRKQGMPATATIRFETTWPRLTRGGMAALEQAIDGDGYSLVVLDTIGRALGRVDTNDYGETTDMIGALQEVAISRDIAVLVLDHTRKPISGLMSDPVDDIIGSTGKSGAVDAVLSLTKSQGKRDAVLSITGREVIQESYALSWDAVTCCWQLDGTTEETELAGRRGMVLSVLQDAYPESLTAGEIAKSCLMHREKVVPLLNDLVTSGHVTREAKRGKEQPYRAIQGNVGV